MNIDVESLSNNWKRFTLSNDNGMLVQLLNYGGIITKILVPDKNGNRENVVLGYKDIQDYKDDPNFFGAIIGRVAGRVAGSTFQIENNSIELEENEGVNHLHGGRNGFHKVIWDTETFQSHHQVGILLTYRSPDGEGNYPGNLKTTITYTLTNNNQFIIDYAAETDKATPITLTNHSYFNLSGNLRETIHNHFVTMDSSRILELAEGLIPTGKMMYVEHSAFDFRQGRRIGDGLHGDSLQNKMVGNGYDHYFIFDHRTKQAVTVTEPISGRVLTIETNQPGMVMYTANNLANTYALTDRSSEKYMGICFETQGTPASLHHDNLPSIILRPNELYQKQTVFTFTSDHT
jgi:aldose 1-epimerase